MNDLKRPKAVGLVDQAQLDMLGSSLKNVFKIGDSGEQFADLLRAMNETDGRKSYCSANDA